MFEKNDESVNEESSHDSILESVEGSDDENEINILIECGIGTWGSEIMTYKKMKKYYSENVLTNIIYQTIF